MNTRHIYKDSFRPGLITIHTVQHSLDCSRYNLKQQSETLSELNYKSWITDPLQNSVGFFTKDNPPVI